MSRGGSFQRVSADGWVGARRAVMPTHFEPMLASWCQRPFRDDGWLFERKLDGVRLLAFRDRGNVELYTRNGRARHAQFPGLVALLADQPAERFVLDGELVGPDGARPGVGLDGLAAAGTAVNFHVFDCPWLAGYDLRRMPLVERKMLLGQMLDFGPPCLCLISHRIGDGIGLWDKALARGWEGIIAKRANSVYRSGRSKHWLKLKCHGGQDLVVGGYLDSGDGEKGIAALLLGYYDDGRLRYAGRVDAGFSAFERVRLRAVLAPRRRAAPPFVDPPSDAAGQWVVPEHVVDVAFRDWGADGCVRQARYRGERDDKDPDEVVREGG